MRVEPYSIDSFVHAIKRGARGLHITRDKADQYRFIRLLYYMNDKFTVEYWERETESLGLFGRPNNWPERKPIVSVVAWTLMPNHFHLLLKETQDGGIAKFMQKLCGSMSMNFNAKYEERGSIFQGAYRGRNVGEDRYLRYLSAYIMVKNVFELYPEGGLTGAIANFDRAWKWAIDYYPFSSLADYAMGRHSPIVSRDILGEIFSSASDFKEASREMLLGYTAQNDPDSMFL